MLSETDSIIVASGSTVYAFAEEIKMRTVASLNIVTPFLRLVYCSTNRRTSTSLQLGGTVHRRNRCRCLLGGRRLVNSMTVSARRSSSSAWTSTPSNITTSTIGKPNSRASDACRFAGDRTGRFVEIRTARFSTHLCPGRGHRRDRHPTTDPRAVVSIIEEAGVGRGHCQIEGWLRPV